MPAHITRLARDARKKEILRLFDQACYGQSRWQTWADFIMLSAIAISNAVDKSNAEQREKMYMDISKKYKPQVLDNFAKMLAAIVESIDENPDQDCLGELYMGLDLGNQNTGQFFTPYHICTLMARISNDDIKGKIEAQGWVSVNDCACGAGALLIAFANECRRIDVNYQTSVLFTAQDIDLVTGCMCYIQLSLLGCPGYVVIGNTLTNPATSIDKRGLIPTPGENVWYTPFYFTEVWHLHRTFAYLDMMVQSVPAHEDTPVPEPPPVIEHRTFIETSNGQLSLF